MSDDIARVREVFAALDEGGVEALVAHCHPEFQGVVPPELSAEPDTYKGHDGIRRYFALWDEDIEDLRFAPQEVFATDDAVIVILRITGRGRGSGAPAELLAPVRITIVDGLLRSMSAHATVEDALAASPTAASGNRTVP
jgi:ketosteroid isomerase-like protein